GTKPWSAVEAGAANGGRKKPSADLLETMRAPRHQSTPPIEPPPLPPPMTPPPIPMAVRRGNASGEASGEIVVKPKKPLDPQRVIVSPLPRQASIDEVPQSIDDITQPGVDILRTPLPGMVRAAS